MTTGSLSAAHLTGLATALAGRYRLERELGAGGMATVWLAEDLRHGRRVAIKVLHPELSAVLGTERFLAEIRTTASLQHPHILPLFDSGAAEGLLYYVMPYVEGETLRARLEREHQLPVPEAVRIATEVADALQCAHERGVVHRDVKPENILLRGGHALVADFGIALAVAQAGGTRMTQTGLSLGTPQYMAPEQAMGERTVDQRADVYALGAVTYEMLAGEPPFTGPTAQAVIARAMTEEPRALTIHRHSVPPHVDAAVRTALEKLPADRFATAAALAAALAAPGPSVSPVSGHGHAAQPHAPTRRTVAMLGAIALLAAATLGWGFGWTRGRAGTALVQAAAERGPVRFAIEPDSGDLGSGSWWYSPPAMSPDGRTVVFAATGPAGTRLYARGVDDVMARPLEGTENGDWPFFSPDGAWVGFVSREAIRKVRLNGGTPVVVARVPPSLGTFLGAGWGHDGTIVFTVFPSGALHRVPAAGGTPSRIAVADTIWRLMYPHALPGGRALLVTASREWRVGRLAVLELETGRLRRFGPGTGARYVAGHVVYAGASGELYRQPFDIERLEPSGPAEEIASGLDVSYAAYSPFDASPAGALVHRASRGAWQVTLVDREGREQRTLPGLFPWSPRFSPDGRLLAYSAFPPGQESGDVWNAETWQTDIWITDVETSEARRLTTDGNDNNEPQWNPEGDSIAYDAGMLGTKDIYVQSATGGSARLLTRRPGNQFPSDWTPDGAVLFDDPGGTWMQRLDGGAPRPFLSGAKARVSRDGQWVAFSSSESGRSEVYVQSYPVAGRRTLVSAGGGDAPAWRRDGRELYYWQGDQLIAASLAGGGAGEPPVVQQRTPLFRSARVDAAGYDVSPDGSRFVLVTGGPRANRLIVALDALETGRPRRQAETGER